MVRKPALNVLYDVYGGPLALHYGRRTPLITLVAHLFYGSLLGAFYQLP